MMSTFSAVQSSTLAILIFPFSFAARMLSMRPPVVVPNGISETCSVLPFFALLMRARTFTFPPRKPSLYSVASISAPVGKSGSRWTGSFRSAAMAASQSSLKLCGRILQLSPTAMPSTPCASSSGNFIGSVTGSLFRPS